MVISNCSIIGYVSLEIYRNFIFVFKIPYHPLRSFILVFAAIVLSMQNGKSQSSNLVENEKMMARKDIIDVVTKGSRKFSNKDSVRSSRNLYFSLMPLSGGSGAEGMSISTISVSFFLGDPKTNNLSNVTFYPTTNFQTYYTFKVMPYLWFGNNNWNVLGKVEIAKKTEYSYGLGCNTPVDSLNTLHYNLFRTYININRRIISHFYLGLGYTLDNFYNISEEWEKSYSSEFARYPFGNESTSLSSGIAFNLLYDSRKNVINPLSGFYANVMYRINSAAFGSDYDWSMLSISLKKYISFSQVRHRTLALWGIYNLNQGEIPYLNLPATGLDYSGWTGRGYRKARYRGSQMLYGELEYRFDFTKSGLWGGVIFTNAESVTEPDSEKFEYVKPAVGAGLRLKFNKYSDSNITFDVAVGKDSWNWYVSLNEVF
jgi:hypothetical protein